MRKLGLTLLAAVMLLTACGTAPQGKNAQTPDASKVAPSSGTPSDKPTQPNITISYSAAKQLPYGGSLIAWKELQSKGYTIKPVFHPKSELSVQAVIQGESQIAQVNPTAAMAAIASGAKVRIIGALAMNHWVLVAPTAITKPEQLSGKRIAVHSETSLSNTVVQYSIGKDNIKDPKILIIPGSAARTQALLSGQIDATSVFLSDAVKLDDTAPGKYHVLLTYTDMPVVDSVLVAHQDWLAKHQVEATDLLQGLIETYRKIPAQPEWALAEAVKIFEDEDKAFVAKAFALYAEKGIWPGDGGITSPSDVKDTILFLKTVTKELDSKVSENTDDYADLRFLTAALANIGKK